jgi:hypothetical protein
VITTAHVLALAAIGRKTVKGDRPGVPRCGRPLDLHDRHVRFVLPDPGLALPDRESTTGTWMSHGSAQDSVMMQVPNVGAFVRALLPVKLTEGRTVTFGVWLAIPGT